MRNLGEFFGHLFKAVKTDPARKRIVIDKTEEKEQRGQMTLRRTTIEEIEIHEASPDSEDERPGRGRPPSTSHGH